MEYAATLKPVRYTSEQHKIDINVFDHKALRIATQLTEAGFEAYLVGGCIRDALLGKPPKDFDIATNARPEEVAGLFRNCRLIGRRFRLAHIHFGREIIEVATFRKDSKAVKTDAQGHVTEDNNYGTIEDDVVRRDFTVNSLYYDVQRNEIIDHLGAMADIKNRVLRLIGDPDTRYTEDPVRMLRAARFAAKLEMPLEAETEKGIARCHQELQAVPPARLFDEAQKLFLSGYGVKSYQSLTRLGLFGELFPDVARVLTHPNRAFAGYADQIIQVALENTDARLADGKPVTLAFLLGAFLWPVYQLQYNGLLGERDNWHSAMHEAVDLVQLAASERVSIPVRLRSMIREMWTLQARFELAGKSMKKMRSLLGHPRFRAAYDFLCVRNQAGEELSEAVHWWSAIQEDNDILPIREEEHTEKPHRRSRRGNYSRRRRA